VIAACLKWADRRPGVDPLTGEVRTDPRTSGASDADRAALEWGLRLGDAWGVPVVAITAAGELADAVLREALAAGAARAIRVELEGGAPSAEVAAALAEALPGGVDVVVCGAWSLDRGSGSVPAFLAAHLGAAQALGLVSLSFAATQPGELRGERRLDRGRRERLRVPLPTVLSVEGGSARLRRAGLDGVLAARGAALEVVTPAAVRRAEPAGGAVRTGPYRPRPRVLPSPPPGLSAGQRVLALTGALVERTPPRRLVLEPAEAADRLLDQLREWGYLR